jgi:DNA-binding MarR family transcriptional regulator
MTREELDRNPGYQLWLVSNAWQRMIRRAIKPLGLTHVQFVILGTTSKMSEAGETVTQRHIARFAAIDENMTSQVIRSLTEKGLISRTHPPDDARAYQIMLTDAGRQLMAEARQLIAPMRQAFFAPLKDRETEFTELLRELATHADACPILSEEA